MIVTGTSLSLLRTYVLPDGPRIQKSFYMFDLSTFEGRLSLLHSLQLLDIEILKQAFEYVFPQYDSTELDLKRARAELRGFLLSTLREELEQTTEPASD